MSDYLNELFELAPQNQYAKVEQFSSVLCDCFSDVSLCCMTCFCPCITFGRIAEIVDNGSSSCGVSGTLYTMIMCFVGCQWVYSCTYQSKLKSQFGMQKDCMADSSPCALCQEYRELQHRGFDVGMVTCMEKHNGVMMTPPPMDGDMTR
ncbi:hypothetical protein RND81_03G176400 [Saponaria officinalis]|uniref:Uncharacterized protein n=1 Tax=Saponaria officinalis TaxID=3572 RepID=A0AAW1M4T6_SAPOF